MVPSLIDTRRMNREWRLHTKCSPPRLFAHVLAVLLRTLSSPRRGSTAGIRAVTSAMPREAVQSRWTSLKRIQTRWSIA